MLNYSGKLVKFVYDKLNKYKILNPLKRTIEYTREKTKTPFTNSFTNSTILQEFRTVQLQPLKPVPNSLIHCWQWYQHLIGLSAVEKARRQMILLQNKLTQCREMRRLLREQASIINDKTKEIYDELLRTKRDDPKYVTLTIMENKNLQEQSKNTEKLNLLEEEEKDYFVHLTTAINEYQDAQALNAQKYKYLSLLASAVAAIVSLLFSNIQYNKRINNIKQVISEMQEKNESTIANCFNSLEKFIDEKLPANVNASENLLSTVEKQPENEWLITAKRTAYVFSILLMLKGLIN